MQKIYTDDHGFDVNVKQRKSMLLLMEDINTLRGYKLDTFFLASSIADHFLEQLYSQGEKAPNLIILSITCLFIAAKMEQPVCPILANLVTVMRQRH